MPDLGLNVLFKGKNLARLLGGLGVALTISLLSVVISIVLGTVLGVLRQRENLLLKAVMPEVTISVDAACCAGVTPEKHLAALETMRSCQIQVKNG